MSGKFRRFNAIVGSIEILKKCWVFKLKWKSVKHFMRPKQRPVLRKLFSLVSIHSPPDKILLYLWNKNFLTQIYRNIYGHLLSKCFKNAVIERPETVPCKCFFGHQTAKSLQFVKSERFLIVLPEHFMFNIKWVEVCKISEIFWAKMYCKTSHHFLQFLLALRKSEIKKKLWWCPLELVDK